MPEKPEVITVSKKLREKLLGRTINKCHVYYKGIIGVPSSIEFRNKVIGETIKDITTRGKFIVFELTNYAMLVHLRMEGKFLFRKEKDKIEKHEHVEFILDNDISFRYQDVRKFGKFYLQDINTYKEEEPYKSLGYEYNDDKLTIKYLYNKLVTRKIPIKTLLLDQKIIAGIGNIYADEILFRSGISPYRLGNEISLNDAENIINNLKIVMNRAIELGGTTIRSFTSSEGMQGKYQNELLVHGKENETCPRCYNKIEKDFINGRGTYYCPNCQR